MDVSDGAECGRWRNGRLAPDCLSAGTEYCMFDCPFLTAIKRARDGEDPPPDPVREIRT